MGIIVDLIIVAILILFILMGYKKGFTGSLIKLASFAIALVLAFVLYKPVANIVIEKTQIDEKGQVTGKNYFADKKTNVFECTKMELSNETGRVKWIEFKYIE